MSAAKESAFDSSAEALFRELGPLDPEARIAFLLERFGDGLRFASSFGLEDSVVVHLAARARVKTKIEPRIFMLDTGRLHTETYDLVERFRDAYGLSISLYAPDTHAVEDLVRVRGPNGFYKSKEARKACCEVRKLEPLGRALAGATAWVTGLRREQSEGRAGVGLVEDDPARPGVLKINPLYDWTFAKVLAFAEREKVPIHPLLAKGFPSIGCAPCTRAVAPGEAARAGRWWWENDDLGNAKECGIHERRGQS